MNLNRRNFNEKDNVEPFDEFKYPSKKKCKFCDRNDVNNPILGRLCCINDHTSGKYYLHEFCPTGNPIYKHCFLCKRCIHDDESCINVVVNTEKHYIFPTEVPHHIHTKCGENYYNRKGKLSGYSNSWCVDIFCNLNYEVLDENFKAIDNGRFENTKSARN